MTEKLKQSLIQQKQQNKQEVPQITGILGIPLDGQRRVEVSGRNAYVYVRLRNNENEVIQAFNNQVSPAYNLPVIVERQGNSNRYTVISVDTQRYENNWNSFAPFLPRHGNTHSFDPETGGGGDVVWVYPRQFTPLLTMPSGSSGGPNVIINPYMLRNSDGTWKYIGNTGTANITTYNPTSPTGAIIVLVYVDSVSGNPGLLVGSGTVFNSNITGVSQIAPYIPTITNPDWIPDSAIRLVTGTSIISWNNIYDVRQFLHPVPTGTGGGSGGTTIGLGVMTQNEGVPLGTGTALNFVGANIDASISGSVVRVFVTGSTGISSIGVEENAVSQGSSTTFNFIGENEIVDASVSGSTARVFVGIEDGPQGFGYNYTIRTTNNSASGTFNVALKTIGSSGNSDPSPTDKLIFTIGEDRREVSSALNFVMTSGTNWFNAGGAELTGQPIDYFVYVIWEAASSAVRLGMSRIPYARTMNDFSSTNTNEKYIRGNYSAFAVDDEVELIGRIRTTKTGTTGGWASSGGFVFSKPIYESDWLTWNPAYSASASMTYTSVSTTVARYKIAWRTVSVRVVAVGTIGGTPDVSVFSTLPFESTLAGNSASAWGYVNIDGLSTAGFAFMSAGTPDRIAGRRYDSANWSAGADRSLSLGADYEIA